MRERAAPDKLPGCIGRETREPSVLHELIRALPAAALVCIAPGYFWARSLVPSADPYERIAYSTAISMALVPTTALLQARLFGTGVTLTIAAVSVVVVFATGYAAYLRLGPASLAEGSALHPHPSLPGGHALVALLAALGLLGGLTFGLVSEGRFTLLAAALLLLLGGLVAASLAAQAPRRLRSALPSRIRWPMESSALILVMLVVVLVRGYLGPVVHDWPFIRGGDQFSHAVMTTLVMTEGKTDPYLVYPPGFHALSALVSRSSGLEPLEMFPVLAPALMVLPALACYALARRLWGRSYGVVALFFSGVLLVGPYASFGEARYPNLVSADFLLVLAVAALIGVYSAPGARSGLLFATLGASVVLYHQVASLYLALLLALVATLSLPYLLLGGHKRRAAALSLSLALLGVLSVAYAWSTYDLPALVSGLAVGSDTGAGGRAVTIAVGSQRPLGLEHLVQMTSQPVLWLGLVGTLLAAGGLLRGRSGAPQTLAYLTVLLWAGLLFAGSRTSLSGFPQRFERDLGIPLAVLAALSFVAILRSLRPGEAPASLTARLVAVPVAALAVAAVGLQTAGNLADARTPSGNVISPEAAAAGEWLGDRGVGGNIVVTPYLNDHIPGSAMLAMGGYTGLRSYTERRLRSPRALPPSGKATLLAARWVTHHPAGERTTSILETYDIRYVTLFKAYPGVSWRAFESHPRLYTKVFENDSVVIFAPRYVSPGQPRGRDR